MLLSEARSGLALTEEEDVGEVRRRRRGRRGNMMEGEIASDPAVSNLGRY